MSVLPARIPGQRNYSIKQIERLLAEEPRECAAAPAIERSLADAEQDLDLVLRRAHRVNHKQRSLAKREAEIRKLQEELEADQRWQLTWEKERTLRRLHAEVTDARARWGGAVAAAKNRIRMG